MGLVERWRSFMGIEQHTEQRYSLNEWMNDLMSYAGSTYPLSGSGSLVGDTEKVGAGFTGYVHGAYKGNGVVFACELARISLFSEARFQWRTINKGRPGKLFGDAVLRPLEEPWPGGTTGDLLTRMLLDADLAGNAFVRKFGNRLERLRPDWVSILYDGDPWEPTTDVAGYIYTPGGPGSGTEPVYISAELVAHFAPNPDPMSPRKGMSWLTPVLREIDGDISATAHKDALFSKGATPNMIVKADSTVTREVFDATVKLFREGHEGAENAYKTLFMMGGFDPVVVGSNLRQLDFKNTQGAGETRIAAAAGVPPVIVGLSEGLQAATYSNYGQARRRFADLTMRPLWRNVSGSLEWLINTPQVKAGRAELWYDERDVAFLQEDRKDLAEIQTANASAMRQLIDGGFEPESVVDAVVSNDFALLEHTGLPSVQLQQAAEIAKAATEAAEPEPPNGKVNPDAVAPEQ